MKKGLEPQDWRQHFPTYYFKDRDVALEEYKFATKVLEAEERLFTNAANIALIVAAALGSVVLGSLDKLKFSLVPAVGPDLAICIIIAIAAGFSSLTIRHFADRQKSVVFAARKVIVLRRMLGMSYGNLRLVLPNWRIEGADEPFSIRLFPGWDTFVAYPCYAISGVSSLVVFVALAAMANDHYPANAAEIWHIFLISGISALWFLYFCWVYRRALLDVHETPLLLFTVWIAKMARLRLANNFEYVIYRAVLSAYETQRMKIDLTKAMKILVHVEDKEFYKHRGVSWKGLARLVMAKAGLHRPSGGSTITQQLARTLFIADLGKLYRRKGVEILLALWLDRVLPKKQQLEIYLSSVRFESGIYGLPDASKHFFGNSKTTIAAPEAFFLVERVSNVRSRLLVEKIDQTLRGAVKAGVMSDAEAKNAILIYEASVHSGVISAPSGAAVERLKKAWSVILPSKTGHAIKRLVLPQTPPG